MLGRGCDPAADQPQSLATRTEEQILEIRILGLLEIDVGGESLALSGRKQRELLAILSVHANEVVSQDRLIEELWEGTPPPSAAKTLQAHVSRLRGALGVASGALETYGHGYRLRLEPDGLDRDVFRAKLEEGRRSLASGDPETAAETLRGALALWRGRALADFEYASFAQAEIGQLEELHLAAREERTEADLELGRHAELVVELDALVAEHPLRERLRGQLMLALYRSGRQAEALQVYQEGRRELAAELGLEPSASLQRLELLILEHDASLAAPPLVEASRTRPASGRRRLRALIVVGVLLVAAAIVAAVVQSFREDPVLVTAAALVLDARSGRPVDGVPLGTAPSAVAVGERDAWVIDADDRTISQIDTATRTLVRTFSTSTTPTDVAAGAGAVWIGNASAKGSVLPSSITRLDADTGLISEPIRLPPARAGTGFDTLPGLSHQHVAVSPDAVWAINPDLTVSRIDPRSNRIVARIMNVKARNIAVGDGDVWVTEGDRIAEIDPGVNAVARRLPLPKSAAGASGIAVGGGAVWVTVPAAGELWRIDTGPTARKRAIALDPWVSQVAFGEGAVWATNEIADVLYRVDPRSGEVKRISTEPSPRSVDAGEGGVWVTTSSPPSRNVALPSSVCRGVDFGREGRPDLLLVASLPFQGQDTGSRSMVDGMRHVLAQRGFEAGAFTVGLQVCDSSTAQAGQEEFFRCGSNAKAFSRNLDVVAVFGSFTSYCSFLQIPITNRAPGGPLAQVSPSNTDDSLTEDDSLFPTGTRSFFRLAAAGRFLAGAQVALAKELRHKRLFILTSQDEEYGANYPRDLRRAARRLGVEIVGAATYDPDAKSFPDLVRRVVGSRPQSVALAGYPTTGAGAMIRELHTALDPAVAISAPDAFVSSDLRELLGAATSRLHIATYGVPNALLPPRGKQFLAEFAAAHGGQPGPDLGASYGAQGTEILLDAIARSDGTRASVTEQLRRTKVRGGILGDVSWDARGDLVTAPVMILRLTGRTFAADRVIWVQPPA